MYADDTTLYCNMENREYYMISLFVRSRGTT